MTSTRNSPTATRTTGRRLTARSAIASTLLGVSPPVLPTRSLVATVELLGIAPGTARVAMSRMVAAGELEASEDGYRLVGRPLLARQARQAISRRGVAPTWDGPWLTAVVTAERRPANERAELRAAMAALRFGELREGVWLRPGNLPTTELAEAHEVMGTHCTLLATEPLDPLPLVRRLWDLDGWAEGAERLRTDVERLGARLDDHDHTALGEGFVTSAAVLRHLQADPLLPADLLSPDWPGAALRSEYKRFDQAFRATLATWLRAHDR